MNSIIEWIKTSWNEESNVGKAKLAAVVALVFLLIASLLPDAGREPALVSPSTGIHDAAGIGPDAARQAAEAYAGYEARVAELETQLAAKDQQIAELERRLAAGGEDEDGGTGNMELRLQLEAMRATLDQLLNKLE